jgi:low temperature requirement protein LtrA
MSSDGGDTKISTELSVRGRTNFLASTGNDDRSLIRWMMMMMMMMMIIITINILMYLPHHIYTFSLCLGLSNDVIFVGCLASNT